MGRDGQGSNLTAVSKLLTLMPGYSPSLCPLQQQFGHALRWLKNGTHSSLDVWQAGVAC